jgi:hypothetical protein
MHQLDRLAAQGMGNFRVYCEYEGDLARAREEQEWRERYAPAESDKNAAPVCEQDGEMNEPPGAIT